MIARVSETKTYIFTHYFIPERKLERVKSRFPNCLGNLNFGFDDEINPTHLLMTFGKTEASSCSDSLIWIICINKQKRLTSAKSVSLDIVSFVFISGYSQAFADTFVYEQLLLKSCSEAYNIRNGVLASIQI